VTHTRALLLQMEQSDVERFTAAGWRIVVARPGSDPPVAWIVERPRPATWLAWDDTCGIYASDTPVWSASAIQVQACVYPSVDRALYSYAFGAFRRRHADHGFPAAHYGVRNSARAAGTFGLVQAATVNGVRRVSPVNAVVLPSRFTADFTAAPTLVVWVQPALEQGSIVASIPENALSIPHSKTDCLWYRYDRCSNSFIDASGTISLPRRAE
jgi:hypothetical protein